MANKSAPGTGGPSQFLNKVMTKTIEKDENPRKMLGFMELTIESGGLENILEKTVEKFFKASDLEN